MENEQCLTCQGNGSLIGVCMCVFVSLDVCVPFPKGLLVESPLKEEKNSGLQTLICIPGCKYISEFRFFSYG